MPLLQRYHATQDTKFLQKRPREPMDKNKELFKGILLFPGTVFILIPAIILIMSEHIRWFCGKTFPESMVVVAVTFFLACVGVSVAVWTVMLFYTLGNGTPAPWAPPKHLIVRGPYAYVRNPMLVAAHAILLAETLLFGSIGILIWTGIFWVMNTLYFKLIEEPGLKHRFGDEYVEYSKNVARWVPRMTPWFPTRSSDRL
jgi:protein-S-isoprenylcysteine O-methyltransferase Ste14